MNNLRFSSIIITFWLSIIISAPNAFGQSRDEIDSLEKFVKTAKEDTSKLSTLNTLSKNYARKNPEKAHEFAWAAMEIARNLNLPMEIAKIYGTLGYIYMAEGKYEQALEYGLKASKIFKEINDQSGYGYALGETGRIYREMGDYAQALEYHIKASNVFEESGDKKGMGLSADNIGGIYREQGNYESALWFHLKASKFKEETGDKSGLGYSYDKIGRIYMEQENYIKALEFHTKAVKFKEESGDKKGMSYTFGEIGNIYSKQGKYAQALEFHFNAAEIREEIGDKRGLGYTLSFIGTIFGKQGNYEKAIEYYLQASNLCEEIGNKKGLGYSFDQIGKIYMEQGKYEIALAYQIRAAKISEEMGNKRGLIYSMGSIGQTYMRQGLYGEALTYLNKGLQLAKATGSKILIRDSYKSISTAYTGLKDYKNALEHYQLYIGMKDSALGEESLRQMANMESKYQAEKKDKEISLLKKDSQINAAEAKKQKILLFSSVLAMILASVLALLVFNRFKLKRKANEQLEQLNAKLEDSNLELDKLSLVARKTDNYVIITNAKDEIVWVNEGFTRITGYTPAEVMGRTPPDVLRGTLSDEAALKIVEDGIKTNTSFSVEILNYDKNDRPIWLFANVTPILDKEGKVLRYISVGSDVTERKRTEEAIQAQKKKIEEKNENITESINYALRIQQSILPTPQLIQKHFPDSFLMYHPKDVVSGDFPWFIQKGDDYYIAAVDCTGHGVPGAFMSIIGHSLLNEIVKEKNIEDPAKILSSLHEGINITLKQTEEDSKSNDGMEVALCKINYKKNVLEFSGANRPLYFVHRGELMQFKGDKIPLGGNEYKFWLRKVIAKKREEGLAKDEQNAVKFTNHKIKFEKNDSLFIFSDGLPDQFGGPTNRLKYGPKRIRDKIMENVEKPMDELSEIFNNDLIEWKGQRKQIDDILLIGVKL